MDPKSFFHIHLTLHNYLVELIQNEYNWQMSHISILECVDNKTKPIMGEVAVITRIPHSSLTGKIDELVSQHMLERIYSNENRRVIYLQLTNEGKVALHTIRTKTMNFIVTQIDEDKLEVASKIIESLFRKSSDSGPSTASEKL